MGRKMEYLAMKTDHPAPTQSMNSDMNELRIAAKRLINDATKVGGLGFGTSFFEWVSSFAAIYLLILDRTNWRTNMLTSLLVPYIFFSLPSVLFNFLRGEFGKWVAFIAVVLRLFFPRYFPGTRESGKEAQQRKPSIAMAIAIAMEREKARERVVWGCSAVRSQDGASIFDWIAGWSFDLRLDRWMELRLDGASTHSTGWSFDWIIRPDWLEMPGSLILLLVVAPNFFAHTLRENWVGVVICLIIGCYLLQEHIRASGGFRNSFTQTNGISNTLGIILLLVYPIWALVVDFI